VVEAKPQVVRFRLSDFGNPAIPLCGTRGFPPSDYSKFGVIGLCFKYNRAQIYADNRRKLFSF